MKRRVIDRRNQNSDRRAEFEGFRSSGKQALRQFEPRLIGFDGKPDQCRQNQRKNLQPKVIQNQRRQGHYDSIPVLVITAGPGLTVLAGKERSQSTKLRDLAGCTRIELRKDLNSWSV